MQRVLLKLSGEALGTTGYDQANVNNLAQEIATAYQDHQLELAVLVGGGNIWRGRDFTSFHFDAAYSDMIGMGATVLNSLVLAGALQQTGVGAKVFSALPLSADVHPHNIKAEKVSMQSGEIVIFAGGTGSPFFTTDSAAVLRALEIGADAVLKGTKVDGVYDSDPNKIPTAKRFDALTYDQALAQNLQIMDATAFALARENQLPVCVFNALQAGGIGNALSASSATGTWVRD